ncbi:MAG: hypothetical protein WC697_04060 [Patescibacteria group bacterium]|jgi:hypothetical protein
MRFLRRISTKKRIIIPILLGLVLVMSFCAFYQVNAQVGQVDATMSASSAGSDIRSGVLQILSWPILFFISVLAKLLIVIIRLLVWVAQYNDFINSPAVSKGWIIIRDICNMSFILALLIIAFCTVLKIENYSYKKLLGKLVMAAVLVNFSKFICGFLIDISQIIMLTFVNAFKTAAEGNFAEMLGLSKILSFRDSITGADINGFEVFGALILGLIMVGVALFVIGIITIILVMRIVTLWFLILLSPLIFVAPLFPMGKGHADQWWKKFSNELIVGPAMAFMLWLSLAVVQDQGGTIYKTMVTEERATAIGQDALKGASGEGNLAASISETGQPQYVLNFIIGIAMLVGSLMVAQQLGVAGSQLAGQGVKGMQNFASGASRVVRRQADLGLLRATKGIGQKIFGQKEYQGISVGTLKEGIQMRKAMTRDRERQMEEVATPKIALGIDRAMDPAVITKNGYDFFRRTKGEIKNRRDNIKNIDKEIDKEKTNVTTEQTAAHNYRGQEKGYKTQLKELNNNEWSYNEIEKQAKIKGIFDPTKSNKELKSNLIQSLTKDIAHAAISATSAETNVKNSNDKIGALTKDKNKVGDEIVNLSSYIPLGLKERERPRLEELTHLKRVGKKTEDMKLSTDGGTDEERLVTELQKQMLTKNGEGIEAASKLLTAVHGLNTLMGKSWVQKEHKDWLIKNKYSQNEIDRFEKSPANSVSTRQFLEHLLRDKGGYSQAQTTKALSSIGNIASFNGGSDKAGFVKSDHLLGELELTDIVTNKNGTLDMGDDWKNINTLRDKQKETESLTKSLHINTIADQNEFGIPTQIHSSGKQWLSQVLNTAIIERFNRTRSDTRDMLYMLRDQMKQFSTDIKTGVVKGVALSQAGVIDKFVDRIEELHNVPPTKGLKNNPSSPTPLTPPSPKRPATKKATP